MSAPFRVLVVDDDGDLRLLLLRWLTDAARQESVELRVEEARNGRDGIAAIAPGKFDLVFTDLVMPGGPDGFDVERASAEAGVRCLLMSGVGALADNQVGRIIRKDSLRLVATAAVRAAASAAGGPPAGSEGAK